MLADSKPVHHEPLLSRECEWAYDVAEIKYLFQFVSFMFVEHQRMTMLCQLCTKVHA